MGKKVNTNKSPKRTGSAHVYQGILDITRSGIGYVIVEKLHKDILIKKTDLNKAFHGDVVTVMVHKDKGGRMEGRVLEIRERKQTEFMGKMEVNDDFGFFIPESSKPLPDFYIPSNNLNNAKDGDRVIVKMIGWNEKDKNPFGQVLSILDEKDSNDLAMKEILIDAGFPLIFSEDALEQSNRIPELISESDLLNRKDMRDVLTFTIDPADARDFDDAISIRELKSGVFEVGVHIADVGHYVEEGSALDLEAYERATSVYLPDRVLPMLPERISNELCSLRPHEDKLTFSCVYQLNTKGEIKQYWIGKTVIHSKHRFTYEDVQDIIENKKGSYSEEILILNEIAQKFRKNRFSEGSINFSSQEIRFKLDENGKPVGIIIKESKEAHQLIEEFMLLANKTVAQKVADIKVNKKNIPFPYRVHDTPDEDKMVPFLEFAKKYGHHFDLSSPVKIASSFNKMLQQAKGKPEQHVLEQLGIRTMAKAIYTTENIGHYGLAFEFYCHFTSPIRRYPDMLVQRVLFSCLNNKPIIDKKMEEKCVHCSQKERAAMDAERTANKYKQVEYMKQFVGEEFDAVISGVASFGFWAETVDHKCEGLISIQSLFDYDDFRHIESEYSLVGKRSGKSFRMGDKIRIKIVSANLTKRQLDYEWILQIDEDERRFKKINLLGLRKNTNSSSIFHRR
ncbi:MAG: ribonuclease R [Chitinophagaceae bacterium]